MKKLFLVLVAVVGLVSGVFGSQHFIAGTVPHYYEFGSENPQGSTHTYYWCGHTALKSVGKYITGQGKTLTQIHNTFRYNSSGYRADNYCDNSSVHWCAKLQDLYWAVQKNQNGGYGKINSVIISVSSYSTFLTKVKDGFINNIPIIVPSNWYYGDAGHFWIIVGYEDSYTGKDEDTIIFLRDVAQSSPTYKKYDKEVPLKEFFDESGYSTMQFLYMKRD